MAVSDVPSPESLRFYRFLILALLCLSDGTYTVLRRYSRGVLKEQYAVNEVLLLGEIYKLLFSMWMISRSGRPSNSSDNSDEKETNRKGTNIVRPFLPHLADLLAKSRRMLILAIIYGAGNILSYYALSRISAGTFVVIAQGKTLMTALFSSIILGRSYSWTKWRALVTLTGGVILFVLPTLEQDDKATTVITSYTGMTIIMGCLAEFVVIILSGYASVYFEKSIKSDKASEGLDIWARNFQLGFHSIFIYAILIVIYPQEGAYFTQWTSLALILSILGAAGGLLVALSIKYSDSVVKTLAITGSILYSSIVDKFALDGPLTGQMVISAVIVILSVITYTFDATPVMKVPPPSPVDIEQKPPEFLLDSTNDADWTGTKSRTDKSCSPSWRGKAHKECANNYKLELEE